MPPWPVLLGRTLFVAIVLLLAFTGGRAVAPARRLPRWLVQLLAVALAAPLATLAVYLVSTGGDWRALFGNEARVTGFVLIGGSALVLGLVLALGALYRERDAQADAQALQFALERETLRAAGADARLALLQSQIEPHFLFNTLANVQALVESGSPRAAPVLGSLIAYLRAAMPRLHEGAPTLGQEEALVRAYLELMQMRMPDRLAFAIDVDPALHGLRLPPMTLLTLVENAVRHGIDPSESGGRIEVGARRDVATRRVHAVGADSGLRHGRVAGAGHRPGQPARAPAGDVSAPARRSALHGVAPHGVRAEITLPATRVHAMTAPPAADRRRRAAAARAPGRAPGAAVAGAADRRPGAQRPRGGGAVRGPRAAGGVPRRAHAGPDRHRRGALHGRGARRSSSSPPTSSTRCRPSSRARSTTWSSRSTKRAWPTRCSACSSGCAARGRRPQATDGALDAVLERLAGELRGRGGSRAAGCNGSRPRSAPRVRLIPVEQVVFLRSDEKYTLVVWDGGEALIRKTIRELADELDPERFVQIHRSVIVNLARVSHR